MDKYFLEIVVIWQHLDVVRCGPNIAKAIRNGAMESCVIVKLGVGVAIG